MSRQKSFGGMQFSYFYGSYTYIHTYIQVLKHAVSVCFFPSLFEMQIVLMKIIFGILRVLYSCGQRGSMRTCVDVYVCCARCCCCCCCCFSHSAHWLPTGKKLLYTVANPARGLLNREKKKKKKSGSAPPPPPPPRAARSEKK